MRAGHTQSERRAAPRIINARRSPTCRHGHPWTPQTTYIHPRSGSRVCRTCTLEAVRRYEERKKA